MTPIRWDTGNVAIQWAFPLSFQTTVPKVVSIPATMIGTAMLVAWEYWTMTEG
jgi:hypothetical protein